MALDQEIVTNHGPGYHDYVATKRARLFDNSAPGVIAEITMASPLGLWLVPGLEPLLAAVQLFLPELLVNRGQTVEVGRVALEAFHFDVLGIDKLVVHQLFRNFFASEPAAGEVRRAAGLRLGLHGGPATG